MNTRKIPAMLLAVLLAVTMTACAMNSSSQFKDGEAVVKDGDVVGEGSAQFTVEIVDGEKNTITVTVKSDTHTKEDPTKPIMVGEVLQELGILEGEEGDYGLYIKAINGRVADYAADGVYWAFYVGGEYALLGVDMTEIVANETYSFHLES